MGNHLFFFSSRGVKQGDPLSPTLFIIVVEVLCRSLNRLNDNNAFKGFSSPKWSENINHLSYADDTILYFSGQKDSIKMMNVLNRYEKISRQLITLNRSFLYLCDMVLVFTKNRI